MTINPHNLVSVTGRLASNPVVKANSDGSRTVLITIMVDRNFKNRNGVRESDAVQAETYIPATVKSQSPAETLEVGDNVTLMGGLRSSQYVQNGQTMYRQYFDFEVVSFNESLASKNARKARKGQAPQASAQNSADAPAQQAYANDQAPVQGGQGQAPAQQDYQQVSQQNQAPVNNDQPGF